MRLSSVAAGGSRRRRWPSRACRRPRRPRLPGPCDLIGVPLVPTPAKKAARRSPARWAMSLATWPATRRRRSPQPIFRQATEWVAQGAGLAGRPGGGAHRHEHHPASGEPLVCRSVRADGAARHGAGVTAAVPGRHPGGAGPQPGVDHARAGRGPGRFRAYRRSGGARRRAARNHRLGLPSDLRADRARTAASSSTTSPRRSARSPNTAVRRARRPRCSLRCWRRCSQRWRRWPYGSSC